MKDVDIRGNTGRSRILIGERIENVGSYLPQKDPIIITDINVQRLYADRFPSDRVIAIDTGEAIKSLQTVETIYQQMVAFDADRSDFILGIGGGIVCDVAGFVASTYMRGVRFGFVSTTLLSQVDASVGGKNGVNFGGYKNMVGVFNQPEFVICDLELLRTLDTEEIRCGFGEIVKHAAIADADMFVYLEDTAEKAVALDMGVIEKLVHDSVVIKAEIVNQDEKETGARRKLNFGHTFGHAIESKTGVLHGQAVSLGMVIASALSVRKGLLSAGAHKRIVRLLQRLELPTYIELDRQDVLAALNKDKKKQRDRIHFVLLESLGRAMVAEIPIAQLTNVMDAYTPAIASV